MLHHIKFILVILCLSFLNACGGGGGKTTTQPIINDQSTNAQTIGGTIRGLSGAVVLANSNGKPITVTKSGIFSFDQKLEPGDNYDISIISKPDNQECELAFSSGRVGESNVRNVEVLCSSPVTYKVVIDIPLTLVGAVVAGNKGQISFIDTIINFFIQPAYADPVTNATIQVVSINPDGTVSKIYASTSAVISDGEYRVTLNSPPRVDLLFLISKTTAQLNQAIPEGIYSIAADKNVNINVASTVAVNGILEATTSFDTLTTAEVSAVITKAETVALVDPSEGQDLQAYINNTAKPAIDPVIVNDISEIGDIDRFTMDYLAGKTLYDVWYGVAEDVDGNPLPDGPGIDRLEFGTDGTLTFTNLKTGRTGSISYQVDADGRAHAAGDDSQGTYVVCDGTDQYINTHHIEDREFNNTDRYYFNEVDADAYWATLTGPNPPCESALRKPILGSWLYSEGSGKRNVLTFIDDDRYMMIHEHDDEPGQPGSQTAGSVEYGNYTWNESTNEFSVSLIGESDGWGGLYDSGSTTTSIQVQGDTLTLDGSVVFTRVIDNSNPLIGAWMITNSEDLSDVIAVTFLSSSEYSLAQTASDGAYGSDLPQAFSGEFGTYSLNENDIITTFASIDTDGDGGFYDEERTQGTATLVLQSSGDLLLDDGPDEQTVLTRTGY